MLIPVQMEEGMVVQMEEMQEVVMAVGQAGEMAVDLVEGMEEERAVC